jgi:hypothetical protein
MADKTSSIAVADQACGNCFCGTHIKKSIDPGNREARPASHVTCQRYPAAITKPVTDWCFEWKPDQE